LEIFRTTLPAKECSYLADELARLEYRLMLGINSLQYQAMLERGWRRFGMTFFRPACPACSKCRSIRVDVASFRPSRSQRRALKRNREVKLSVGRPKVDDEVLDLHDAYHHYMAELRDWPGTPTTRSGYVESFIEGAGSFAREFRYSEGGRLIGVGYVDLLPSAMSSVYFFHAPEWRSRSPGTYSALMELAIARNLGLPWHYLGYWIPENQSMAYKSRFKPHELLTDYGPLSEQPGWRPPSPEDQAADAAAN